MTTILAFLLFSLMVPLSNVTGDAIKLSQEKCEEFPERVCPACGSRHLIKNGSVGKSKLGSGLIQRQGQFAWVLACASI